MGAPEDHSPANHHDANDSQHGNEGDSFVPKGRPTRFIVVGLLRLLGTAILAVLFYLLIRFHQDRTLTSGQKTIFDALVVAISLALGLNSAASLRHIAIHAKRWFDGRRNTRVTEIEVHSSIALVQLLLRTPVPLLKFACAIWLLLNLAMQAGIAAIGLTFKAEPGIDVIYLDSVRGDVAIPDMSRYARVGQFTDGPRPQLVAAHILGDIGTGYEYSTLPSEVMTDAPVARYPYAFWDAGSHWEFVFAHSAPAPGSQDFNFLSVYSDQAVRSSATCRTPPYTFTLSGGVIEIHHTDGPNKTMIFPALPLGEEAITYLTEPVLRGNGTNNSTGTCGPGCSVVYVVEPETDTAVEGSSSVNPASTFFYYQCNVTVRPVQEQAGHFNLSPTNAAVAAQAIAGSGQRAPLAANSSALSLNYFTAYTLGLEFGQPQSNNATAMARMLSRFAIGVVAAAAHTNPKILIEGNPPRQGVRLTLDKPVPFAAILCATAGVQLVLLAAALLLVPSADTGKRGHEPDVVIR